MGWKSFIIAPLAKFISNKIARDSNNAYAIQKKILLENIRIAKSTVFGKDHAFHSIHSYSDFKKNVPIRDYEQLKPYIDRILEGESHILWPGIPKYLAKTSGTTSGIKYIPISKESIPNHFGTARNALFNYFAKTGNGNWLDGKVIFLSGSPKLTSKNGIPIGRLSGISNHMVPNWLKKNQLPSFPINCIEEWEDKLQGIVEETKESDLRLISGIPPWVQMYYEQLITTTGKKNISEIFPNFSVFVYGGVNFEPYRSSLENLTGKKIDSVETYPASEGFIAFQDEFPHQGLLLNVNSGIFYEFVPLDQIHLDNPERLCLHEVKLGVQYAIIINNNAGLWGYNIGDTIEFLSLLPPRLKVTGRVKHFISAFGEHVISKEVEESILEICTLLPSKITEFTVAPQVSPIDGSLPHHEWLIEFEQTPSDLEKFSALLDKKMTEKNIYYKDLIDGKILRPLVITPLQKDAFRNYMKSIGKLGGQNKVPRLANDRKIADALNNWIA
jgi:hypothetical protein